MPESFDEWETEEIEEKSYPEAAQRLREEADEMESKAERMNSRGRIDKEWVQFYREEASAFRRAASILDDLNK